MPCAIYIAAHGIDGTKECGPIRGGRAERETGKFMRYRGNDPVDIPGFRDVFDPTRQISRRHMGRNAQGIPSSIVKSLRYTGRRFHLGNRIAYDKMKSGRATR
jgi:hypothetical protein